MQELRPVLDRVLTVNRTDSSRWAATNERKGRELDADVQRASLHQSYSRLVAETNPEGTRCAKEISFGIDRFEFSDCITDLNRYTSAHFSAVDRVGAQLFLNPQKLIVFGDAVGATERTGLYLPGVRGYGDVRDRRVLGFA